MPTYLLKQIEDYWIIISDEQIKEGDKIYFLNGIWDFGNSEEEKDGANGKYKVIAQSRRVLEGIPEFDLPSELDGKKVHQNPMIFGMEYVNPNLYENNNVAADDYKRKVPIYTEDQLREAMRLISGIAVGSLHLPFDMPEETNEIIQSLNKPKQYQVRLEEENGIYQIIDGKIKITSYKEV